MDVYDWIISTENRDYLKENHEMTFEAKVRLICGSLRPLEEKHGALIALSAECVSQEDHELIESLLRLYNWAFAELQKNAPGQIFVFMESSDRSFDDVLNLRTNDVERVFHTYDDLQTYICEYANRNHVRFRTANIEKWIMAGGELQRIMDLHLCVDHGRAFIDRFDIPRTQYITMGIGFHAQMANTGDFRTKLSIPFQSGDLVRISIPVLQNPIYGVLYIYDALGRYMHMAYIEDQQLKFADMSYQDIGAFSGWRVIDWIHSAQMSELPRGQGVLAELSDLMHRKDLITEQEKQLLMLFHSRPKSLLEGMTTLAELLEETNNEDK